VATVADPSCQPEQPGARRRNWLLAVGIALAFVAFGFVGAYRYVEGFWLYRGFGPPRAAAFVHEFGSQESFSLQSPALGGRRQQVVVYLPPGYRTHPRLRYPVLYLLHGVPGRPADFLLAGRMGVWADTLYAQHAIAGIILVMPSGSTSLFDDTEWANGVRPGQGWETFVARDVVQAIDARYRTIRSPQARAIAGLSEGGYGALNIALHHPGEFQVVESWSGYVLADNLPSVFGRRPALLAYNSPIKYLPHVAATLRRQHTYFWFYCGSSDSLRVQNAAFAAELARFGIAHRYFIGRGGHSWQIWRANAPGSILAAATRLTGGR
jgi:S-formylglutathione hydrolase FrmB